MKKKKNFWNKKCQKKILTNCINSIIIIIVKEQRKVKKVEIMNLLIMFIVLSIVNVILQTVKSICTVKCGKGVAALVNAIAFGLYTVVIVYTNADFPLWEKVLITSLVNLVGVYIVKLIEEKMRKEQLWKIELTVRESQVEKIAEMLEASSIPYNFMETSRNYVIFNVYCASQNQSIAVKEIAKQFRAKYFASETKIL